MSLGRKGFSLIEALLVLALIVVALLGMIAVFLHGYKLMSRGEELTLSSNRAVEFLENCKALDFEQIPEESSFDSNLGQEAEEGFPPLPYEVGKSPALRVRTSVLSPTLKSLVVAVEQSNGRDLVFEIYIRP